MEILFRVCGHQNHIPTQEYNSLPEISRYGRRAPCEVNATQPVEDAWGKTVEFLEENLK